MRVAAAITLVLVLAASAAVPASGSPLARAPRAELSAIRTCNGLLIGRSVSGVVGQPFVFSWAIGCLAPGIRYSDPVILWGDGTTSAAQVPRESEGEGEDATSYVEVEGRHTYTEAGSFKIGVDLTNDQTGHVIEEGGIEVAVISPAISTPR